MLFMVISYTFLSTLSLRRATRLDIICQRRDEVSIHALLAESDGRHSDAPAAASHRFYPRSPCGERRDVIAVMTEAQSVSIHALLAESDMLLLAVYMRAIEFLSTLSLRRATTSGRDSGQDDRVSIHALLAESDLRETVPRGGHVMFLSTLSLRRATRIKFQLNFIN